MTCLLTLVINGDSPGERSITLSFATEISRASVISDLAAGVRWYIVTPHDGGVMADLVPAGDRGAQPIVTGFYSSTDRDDFAYAMRHGFEITKWGTPPSSQPADLAWTPERATQNEIVRAYHGTVTGRDASQPGVIVIKFTNVVNAATWAKATGMTSRVYFPGGIRTLTEVVRVWLNTSDSKD